MSAPFLEQALEEVVDIVMLYGEYPQPPRGGFSHRGTRKFDLVDFLRDNPAVLDPDDALGFFVITQRLLLAERESKELPS